MRVIQVFRELDGARYGSLAALQPIIEIGELDAGVFTRDTTHNSDINDAFDVVSSYEAAGNSGYSFGPTITPTARFVSGVAVFTNMGFVRDYITNPNADIIEAATIGFNYPGIQIISSAPFNISNATKVVVTSTIQPSLFANRKVSIPIVVEVQDASSNPVLLAGVAITLTGTNTTLTGTLSGVTNASGVVTFSNVIPSNGTACDMAAAIVVSSLGLTPFTYNTVILQKEIIKPRRSEVTGAVPLASELDTYEMAINLTDKKIFAKKSDGTVVVVAGDPPDMTNANTAYTERRQWDGGSTNLNATTAKVSLGLVPGVDVQGYDADLQAIGALASGTGLLKKTGSTWSLDSSAYLTSATAALDASTLNSQPGSYYLNYNNLTNKPTLTLTVNATAPLVATTGSSGNTVLSIPLSTNTVAGYMSSAQATSLNTITASTPQNRFYASPATATGVPTFRNILASDIPILNQDTTGNAATATTVIGGVLKAGDTMTGGLTIAAGSLQGSYGTYTGTGTNTNFAAGTSSLLKNTTGSENTSVGYRASFYNTSGSSNTAIGSQALNSNTTGPSNTAIGATTLLLNTTGSGNTALGSAALVRNTSGSYNTAVGLNALFYNTTAIGSTAVGSSALYSNTTGVNVAVGYSAMLKNTTGDGNIAVGYTTLYNNTSGGYNTAIGNGVLYLNTTGSANVAIGHYALDSNSVGQNNTVLGYGAGGDCTTGNNNTIVGATSGTWPAYGQGSGLTTGSGNTILGANVQVTQNALTNNIILASGDGVVKARHDGTNWTFSGSGTFTNGVVGSGATLGANTFTDTQTIGGPNSRLTGAWGGGAIFSNFAVGLNSLISNTTGGENIGIGYHALSNNTTASANVGLGMHALTNNVTGSGNTAIGNRTLSYNTASNNTATGMFALGANITGTANTANGVSALGTNTTGSWNTAMGLGSLQYNTTGYLNTGIGHNVLNRNTIGMYNTGVGSGALFYNTTGQNNTGIGQDALANNSTGSSSTAVGFGALYGSTQASYNTAIGQYALNGNTSGYWNTAVGGDALKGNSTGYFNTAIGGRALYTNTTGYFNTAVGYQALQTNGTGLSNTAVGYQALFTNSTGSANVGVGLESLYQLNGGNGCNVGVGFQSLRSTTNGGRNTAIGYQALTSNTIGESNTAIGNKALFNNITGTNNTAISPDVQGSYQPVFDPTSHSNRFCMGSTAVTNAYIQVAWTVVSDARDKTEFAEVPHGLDFVNNLKPIAYRYKMNREDTEGHGPVRYGFKAQDVLALEGDKPVIVDAEDLEKLRFNDQSMIAVLVNALKELNAKFDAYVATHP